MADPFLTSRSPRGARVRPRMARTMELHPAGSVGSNFEGRLVRIERRLRRAQLFGAVSCTALLASWTLAFGPLAREVDEIEHLRVRRLELVDDAGVVRLALGQDPKDGQRRSRAAGLTVHDKTGAERGGFSTFDDGSVVLAMDAPRGVGDPMPDRLGLRVDPDGSCCVMLLDNQTRAVAKLHSDGQGGGGVQVFQWDMEKKQVHIKTETYDGPVLSTVEMGG